MSLNLDDYFETAFAEKLSIRMPERGPQVSGATRLLELRHEQSAVERALSSTKEEFQMQRESLQQRQVELSHKESQLKDSLLKFDRFLKENDMKRERASRKAREERALSLRKAAEAQGLGVRLSHLRAEALGLRERCQRGQPALALLERAVGHSSSEFHDVRQLLSRHETLRATRSDLERRCAKGDRVAARERAAGARWAEGERARELALGGELGRLQEALDAARARGLAAESRWTHIQNTACMKTLLLGQIRMATFNLHQLVAGRMGGERAEPGTGDTERQLTEIQMFVEDLGSIVKELRRGEGGVVGAGGH